MQMNKDTRDYFAEVAAAEARNHMVGAYGDTETPEAAADRLQKARTFNVAPGQVEAITPAELAAERARSTDWLALQETAPVLTELLGQRAIANLYKDDLTNASVMERMIYALAPEQGEKEGGLDLMHNAFARSAFRALSTTPFFGRQPQLEALSGELEELEKIKSEYDSGADISRYFVTAEDETGQVGAAAFAVDYERRRREIEERIRGYAVETARATQFSRLYPESAALREFMDSDTAGEAVSKITPSLVGELGVDSLVSNAPMLLLSAASPGTSAQMGAAFLSSFALDREAGLSENLQEAGVDWADAESIAKAFLDPSFRPEFAQAAQKAEAHAFGTAIFDALSMGVASKTLVPKSAAKSVLDTAYKRQFANMAVQMPVQGAFGAAGEAAGQLMSDGEISSWADVVAEAVGEQFTAPVEVFTTGLRARAEAVQAAKAGEDRVKAAEVLIDTLEKSKVDKLDPASSEAHMQRVADLAGITSASIDATAFRQMGFDKTFEDVPEVRDQVADAVATGGDIKVSPVTFIRMLQKAGPELMGITSLKQEATPSEAQEAVADTEEAVKRQTAEAAQRREEARAFSKSLSNVGRVVGKELRRIGITREEASGLQAIVQAFVGATARDLGMDPTELWARFGPRIVTELEARQKGLKPAPGVKGETTRALDPTKWSIVRWKRADRSTLLHELAHAFLEMRIEAARFAEETAVSAQTSQVEELKAALADPDIDPDTADQTRSAIDAMSKADPKEFLGKTQKAYLASLDALLLWAAGVKSREEWYNLSAEDRTKAHEKFARTFEAYVMGGRTPNAKLTDAFYNFSRWLRSIYAALATVPGSNLTDESAELFDTLFISQEQVREAVVRQNAHLLFNSPEEAGMSPVEWEAYNEYRKQVGEQAVVDMTSRNARVARRIQKIRNDLLRELRAEGRNRTKAMRDRIEERVKKTRIYKAWDVLKNGTVKVGKKYHPKLSRTALQELGFKRSQIERLERAGLASKQDYRQPIPIDDLGRELGYGDGKELVNALLDNLDIEERIDRMTVDRMLATAPEFANERNMQAQANASIFNEAKIMLLEAELAALEKMVGSMRRTESRAFEMIAHEIIDRLPVADLDPREYVRAANRAAKASRRAWAAGDVKQAIFFKRQEIYQAALAKEAREVKTELSKAHGNLSRFLRKRKGTPEETRFMEVIQIALANLGIFSRKQLFLNDDETQAAPDHVLATFEGAISAIEADFDRSLDIDPALRSAIAAKDPSILQTVHGYRLFMDFIKQMETLGRYEGKVRLNAEEQNLAELQSQGAEAINANADEHGRPAKVRREEMGKKAEILDRLKKFGLSHMRAATLCAVLDGSTNGFFTRLFIHSSDACASKEETLRHTFTERLFKILKPVFDGFDREGRAKKTSTVLGHAFSTAEVFTALLNYGNDGNRQRVLVTLSAVTGIDLVSHLRDADEVRRAKRDAEVDAIMSQFFSEYLTQEHIRAAEKVWAVFEDMRQKTDAVARRVNGRSPVWVKPRAFVVTIGGQQTLVEGGYYPIAYDRQLSPTSGQYAGVQEVKTSGDMKGYFDNRGIADGHLQSRVSYMDAGVTLVPRALFAGLDEQIHYVSWAEWVNETRKLLNPRGLIAKAISERYGNEWLKALQDWQAVCRDGNRGQVETADVIADTLRQGVSLAGVGFNISTALLQIVGVTQSIAYLGGRWAARGMGDFLRLGPTKAFRWVASRSPLMRNRMRTQFRELAEVQTRLQGTTGGWRDAFMRAAYLPLTVMQMAVDIPTWLGAYQKALYEGRTEKEALAEADRAVTTAQGSGRFTDLSPVERGSAWQKLFTVFYTFFNTALNLAVIKGETERGMKRATSVLLVLLIQPVIESFLKAGASELLGTGGDDDDDEWAEKLMTSTAANVASFNLGLFAGVREMSWILGDFGYQGPSGLRKITDTGRAALALGKPPSEWDEMTLKATVSALGVWTGVPVVPINRFISGAVALDEGETDNPLVLLTGYSSK